MSAEIDRLEAIARAAQEYGESIGAQRWYAPGEVQGLADPDDAHIATFSPSRVLALLAVVRAAQGVSTTLGDAWHAPALRTALAALAQLEDRNG